MIPGNSRLLKCPFCGVEKEVLSLTSGNNLGGRHWTDLKSVYPMLPRVSSIQQCPACGKYYFRHEVEERKSERDLSWDLGTLSYEQLREAAAQFGDGLSEENRSILNKLLLWAYNDKYNREREDGETAVAPAEEQRYIEAVLDELMADAGLNDIVRAEYYRERGRFEDAVALLDSCQPNNESIANIVARMKTYAKENNRIAFKI